MNPESVWMRQFGLGCTGRERGIAWDIFLVSQLADRESIIDVWRAIPGAGSDSLTMADYLYTNVVRPKVYTLGDVGEHWFERIIHPLVQRNYEYAQKHAPNNLAPYWLFLSLLSISRDLRAEWSRLGIQEAIVFLMQGMPMEMISPALEHGIDSTLMHSALGVG